MEALLQKYKLRFIMESGKICVCLDDFVENIIESKDTKSYIAKVKDKIKKDKLHYKDLEYVQTWILNKSKKEKAKMLWKEIQNLSSNQVIDEEDGEQNQ